MSTRNSEMIRLKIDKIRCKKCGFKLMDKISFRRHMANHKDDEEDLTTSDSSDDESTNQKGCRNDEKGLLENAVLHKKFESPRKGMEVLPNTSRHESPLTHFPETFEELNDSIRERKRNVRFSTTLPFTMACPRREHLTKLIQKYRFLTMTNKGEPHEKNPEFIARLKANIDRLMEERRLKKANETTENKLEKEAKQAIKLQTKKIKKEEDKQETLEELVELMVSNDVKSRWCEKLMANKEASKASTSGNAENKERSRSRTPSPSNSARDDGQQPSTSKTTKHSASAKSAKTSPKESPSRTARRRKSTSSRDKESTTPAKTEQLISNEESETETPGGSKRKRILNDIGDTDQKIVKKIRIYDDEINRKKSTEISKYGKMAVAKAAARKNDSTNDYSVAGSSKTPKREEKRHCKKCKKRHGSKDSGGESCSDYLSDSLESKGKPDKPNTDKSNQDEEKPKTAVKRKLETGPSDMPLLDSPKRKKKKLSSISVRTSIRSASIDHYRSKKGASSVSRSNSSPMMATTSLIGSPYTNPMMDAGFFSSTASTSNAFIDCFDNSANDSPYTSPVMATSSNILIDCSYTNPVIATTTSSSSVTTTTTTTSKSTTARLSNDRKAEMLMDSKKDKEEIIFDLTNEPDVPAPAAFETLKSTNSHDGEKDDTDEMDSDDDLYLDLFGEEVDLYP